MQVPFHRPFISKDDIDGVVESLREGWITMGEKTIQFEKKFADYIGSSHAVAVNSATAALHLALKAVGLKEGDEVIIPAMTFVASAEVVRYFGARPVFVDIDKGTHLMQVEKIEEKITEKTRVIMPVHYAGQPCDMDGIVQIAEKYDLFVIEDAAHSLPAWYKEKKIGTMGDITCFSFYATKTLTTGEGGMVVTNNGEWADRIRVLRLHGISKDAWKRYSSAGSWKYDVLETGYKYNTTDICAALGLTQLKKLESMWHAREEIANRYNGSFRENPGLIVYEVKSDRRSSWHLYPLKLDPSVLRIGRDDFIETMKKRGIGTSVHFIPLYLFTCYRDMGYISKDYPNTDWVFDRIVSLPIFPGMKKEEVDYVIDNTLDIITS